MQLYCKFVTAGYSRKYSFTIEESYDDSAIANPWTHLRDYEEGVNEGATCRSQK